MDYKNIRKKFQTMDTSIQITQSLLKNALNGDLTAVVITKMGSDCRDAKKELEILLEAQKKEKKILASNLQEVARTYNDVEQEVFVKRFIQSEKIKQIALEMSLSEDYTRHIVANLSKSLGEADTNGD